MKRIHRPFWASFLSLSSNHRMHYRSPSLGPMSLDVQDIDKDGDWDVIVGEHNLENPAEAAMWVYENVDGLYHATRFLLFFHYATPSIDF